MCHENDTEIDEGKKYEMTFRRLMELLIDKFLKNAYFALLIFFMFGSLLLWMSYKFSNYSGIAYALRSVGGGLFAAAFITIIARIFIVRHYIAFEDSLQKFVRVSIESSLDDLREHVTSSVDWVKHLSESNVSNVYPSRRAAAKDMKTDILLRETNVIQISGISLNDFVRANSDLHDVWASIVKYVSRKMATANEDMNIRVLVVHPDYLGAELRSLAEHRRDQSGASIAGRLRKDVRITAESLVALENSSLAANAKKE